MDCLYSAFIQSALHRLHSPIHTPKAASCHAGCWHSHREQFGVGCLAQAGDRTTDLPIYLLSSHRLPSMQFSPACSLLQLNATYFWPNPAYRLVEGKQHISWLCFSTQISVSYLECHSALGTVSRKGLLSEGLLLFLAHLRACESDK